MIPRFNSVTKHLPAIRGLSIPRQLYRKFLRKDALFRISDFDGDLHLDVDIGAIRDGLARVMPEPRMIAVSGKTGEGIAEWLAWLETRRLEARR